MSIWVPPEGVDDITDDEQSVEGVLWLPEQADDEWWGIHVVLAHPDRGTATPKRVILLAGFYLANRQSVLVLASRRGETNADREWLDLQRKNALDGTEHIWAKAASADGLRLTLGGAYEDGQRFVMDLALPVER